jgi:hypothetical protein
VQTADVDGLTEFEAVFDNVADGPGTLSAQALDVNGAAILAPATTTFTAPAGGVQPPPPPTTFPQPTSITATVTTP